MGFIFQLCDRSLSKALQVEPVAYGEQLMEAPAPPAAPVGVSELAKGAFKAILANPNPDPNPKPKPHPHPLT